MIETIDPDWSDFRKECRTHDPKLLIQVDRFHLRSLFWYAVEEKKYLTAILYIKNQHREF